MRSIHCRCDNASSGTVVIADPLKSNGSLSDKRFLYLVECHRISVFPLHVFSLVDCVKLVKKAIVVPVKCYFLRIAKHNTQKKKHLYNRKTYFPENTTNRQTAKLKISRFLHSLHAYDSTQLEEDEWCFVLVNSTACPVGLRAISDLSFNIQLIW